MKNTDSNYISKCCRAPVYVAHGCDSDVGHMGGKCDCTIVTMWYECTVCKKPCDFEPVVTPSMITRAVDASNKAQQKVLDEYKETYGDEKFYKEAPQAEDWSIKIENMLRKHFGIGELMLFGNPLAQDIFKLIIQAREEGRIKSLVYFMERVEVEFSKLYGKDNAAKFMQLFNGAWKVIGSLDENGDIILTKEEK